MEPHNYFMQRLRRIVQFFLGLEAVGMMGCFGLQLFTLFTLRTQVALDELPPYAYPFMILFAVILPVLGAIPTMAWWTLKKGKRAARRWTLAASILNILVLASGTEAALLRGDGGALPLYFVCGAIGILGLVGFWQKDSSIPVTAAPKLIRHSGDGTSATKDYTSQVVSFAFVWTSFHYWRQFSESQGLASPGFVEGLLLFQVAIIVNTFIHEMGHFVAGWASGMILRRFQVGPFQWAIRNGAEWAEVSPDDIKEARAEMWSGSPLGHN